MYSTDFIRLVEEVVDRFPSPDAIEAAVAVDGIRSIMDIVSRYRADVSESTARQKYLASTLVVREEWLKEARKAWVAALPSPADAGLLSAARCGDYVNPHDRPPTSYYGGFCSHKAKYATPARRHLEGVDGPMRAYCGVHANEIARYTVRFPRDAAGEAIYRERIEGFDALRKEAGLA